MIELDEDALVCDFAEFYHIYNYKVMPLQTVATLAGGLGQSSRIMKKIKGCEYSIDTMINVRILDHLQLLLYSKTKDAQKGINKPEMMLDKLLNTKKKGKQKYMTFKSIEEYENFMRKKRGEQA